MKKAFLSTQKLDLAANSKLFIESEILMENAASALEKHLKKALKKRGIYGLYDKFDKKDSIKNAKNKAPKILILCGSGDNGADCLALARRILGKFELCVLLLKKPKSQLCQAQLKRLQAAKNLADSMRDSIDSMNLAQNLAPCEILSELPQNLHERGFCAVIDGVFGSGFKGDLEPRISQIFSQINSLNVLKIACDIPSALGSQNALKADITITMGAPKISLFLDNSKDFVGKVFCANLGVQNALFCGLNEVSNSPLVSVSPYAKAVAAPVPTALHWCKTSASREVSSVAERSGKASSSCDTDTAVFSHSNLKQKENIESENLLENTKFFILQKRDYHAPKRAAKNANKGNFGHLAVILGQMCGAAIIAADSALHFGVGLASLIEIESSKIESKSQKALKNATKNKNLKKFLIPPYIMLSSKIPANANALVLGCGLGRDNLPQTDSIKTDSIKTDSIKTDSIKTDSIKTDSIKTDSIKTDSIKTDSIKNLQFSKNAEFMDFIANFPIVLDADIFYSSDFKTILKAAAAPILTPHPKEFSQILKALNLGDFSIEEIQKNRFLLCAKFCAAFPNSVLLLKGANVIISQNDKIFINHFGNSALAKGGSGDVLAGLIGAELARNLAQDSIKNLAQIALKSTINASLAHTIAANKFCKKHENFALTPHELIKQISKIKQKN